jgi:hypothetical protein
MKVYPACQFRDSHSNCPHGSIDESIPELEHLGTGEVCVCECQCHGLSKIQKNCRHVYDQGYFKDSEEIRHCAYCSAWVNQVTGKIDR